MVTKHLNVNVSLVHSIHLAPVTPVMISALSTSFISLKAFWELYISSNLVLESSGITPGDLSGSVTISTLGVLPENLSTGWILMIDQKYFLTVTPFWAQTIFYAYGGLTRCGPFDKIWLICFRVTS